MPDTKITALTALTTADPATDMFPIVDVSDTTMAGSGTTKRISINNILACSPSATLASATITGAATVGTTLGVTGVSTFAAGTALLPGITTTGDTNTGIFNPAADTWAVSTGGTERFRVDSTGLGVGVVPSAGRGAIQLSAGVGFPATQVASSDANTLDDYEEGSWVPTLNSGTFSSASCRYTKIGNMVTIFFDVTVGTGGGNQITNLPFTAAATSTVANGIYTNNQDYAAGTTAPVVVVGGSSTTLFFRTVGDNVAFSAMTLTAAANLTGSISYFV
jgi:hypothetical protein